VGIDKFHLCLKNLDTRGDLKVWDAWQVAEEWVGRFNMHRAAPG